MIVMRLEDLLQARRTMNHCATEMPKDVFEMAKADYLRRLKEYQNVIQDEDQERYKRFKLSEESRAEQLSLFNDSRPVDDSPGDNGEIRQGIASPGSKSSEI